MTKYYYTDLLVAAYMAREFGVKLYEPKNEEYAEEWHTIEDLYDVALFLILWQDKSQKEGVPKVHIHPDSEKIFEPQEGDLCVYPNDPNYYFSFSSDEPVADDIEIILRDNKHFFMPLRKEK